VASVPVTIPYERYSIETAHWWIGRALAETIRRVRDEESVSSLYID